MAFFVHWGLVNRDGQVVDNGCFEDTFADRATAVSFVFARLDVAPRYGFVRKGGYWWLSGADDYGLETRLWIDADATICAQQITDAGVA
ncbi:MAG: hypothetical protein JJU21_01170 [Salinarimonas sp.]|nr:hypothetical protein [Salinarimonas sp.]